MAALFRIFQFGDRQLVCDGDVHLMGIVNVTPDSFFDGGGLKLRRVVTHG